jgi:putative hydrolase of the HAD superfamily
LIKAILFDLDDTLLDRALSIEAFVKQQHQQYKLDHVPYTAYQRRFAELDERGYSHKPAMFQMLIAEFGVDASVDAWLADFEQQAWHSCVLLPDAIEVLSELRARGYKLGVITNGEDWSQARKLRVTGLLPLFDLVVISGNERIHKPDPQIFTRAAERLGVPTSQCAFVGDHPRNDIYGASAVGMTTVWYAGDQQWPGDSPVNPHHTIAALRDLLELEWEG